MTSTLPQVQQDALAEYLSTRDTGCEESPTCLDCPLPQCKHDEEGNFTDRASRDDYLFQLRKQGMSMDLIARTFNISMRSLQRIISRGGASEHAKLPEMRITPNAKRLQVPPAVYAQACPRCNGPVEIHFTDKTAQCMSCGRDPRSKPVTSSAQHSKSNGQF